MAPTKRSGGTAADKKPSARQERPSGRGASGSFPVHVPVGIAAVIGIISMGMWHWWQLTEPLPEKKPHPPKRRPVKETGPAPASVWVGTDPVLEEPFQFNVTCAKAKVPGEGACMLPRLDNRCARFVIDNAVPAQQATELRDMVQWLVDEAWGAGAGPPSVVDLHAGSISYKDKFIDLAALMHFKSVDFTDAHAEAYNAVRRSIRSLVARTFGIPEDALLHDLTFFSHINASKKAQTLHDEYWHRHTDTEQYGTFAFTTLLYLSTAQDDFEGGNFVFDDAPTPRAVVPSFNRLVVFSSASENDHRVEKVASGVRIALTAAFTCDLEKAKSIEAFPENFVARRAAEAKEALAKQEAEKNGGSESAR